jgi:hypothetical protein
MTALASVGSVDLGQVIDPNASPVGSIDTNTTPDTEFSPPDTPIRQSGPPKDARTLAKSKLATLTTEEKVCCGAAGPFQWHRGLTFGRCLCWQPQTSGERRQFRKRTSRLSRRLTGQTVLVAAYSSAAQK